jgi:hypothetical protein
MQSPETFSVLGADTVHSLSVMSHRLPVAFRHPHQAQPSLSQEMV